MIKQQINVEKLNKTTELILTAARAVFAEKGYSGTQVVEIVQLAGVNKLALYYQIGDKRIAYF